MSKESFIKKLGCNINLIRSGKNMSQTDLAKKLGKPKQNIQRIESGKIMPSIYYVKQIADVLNVSVDQLLNF
jgi:transcriptional regulator with XRE-family HTH domain